MTKEYTEKELADIGRKILAQRAKGKEASATRSKVKSTLYAMWKSGDRTPIGDIKV